MIDGVLSPMEGPHQLEMVGRDKNKYCAAHDLMVDAKTGAPGASYIHLKSEWLLTVPPLFLLYLAKPHHWYTLSITTHSSISFT